MENATSAKSKGILKKLKNFRADGKLVSGWLFFRFCDSKYPLQIILLFSQQFSVWTKSAETLDFTGSLLT